MLDVVILLIFVLLAVFLIGRSSNNIKEDSREVSSNSDNDIVDIPPEDKLVQWILVHSAENALSMYNNPTIVDKDKVSEQGLIGAMFEIAFFYVHCANRMIFSKFGLERRNQIINSILDILWANFVNTVLKDYNATDIEILNAVYKSIYGLAEPQYGICISLFEEKSSAAAREAGESATATLTVITDRLYKVFTGKDIAYDIIFVTYVKEIIITNLSEGEIESAVNCMD
ncbi:MAG: hypothetical protein GXY40_11230 [Syntrophomonadaceae bacterium]|nr:hypothetical protein [Syntrophomonadaceae bacterium]